jgi:DNA-binding NarL/FixJ family response regulator
MGALLAGGAACEIRRASPQTRLVLLAETALRAVVNQALRLNASGLLLRTQPAQELRASLLRVLRGELVFPDEVSQQLVSRRSGARLPHCQGANPLDLLTSREIEVLRHLAQGQTIKQCAQTLSRSLSTIDNHKARIMKKLGVHRSVDLVLYAVQAGIVEAGQIAFP